MKPYLRGIHMTLDSWRPGRDSEGWRTLKGGPSLLELARALGEDGGEEGYLPLEGEQGAESPPERVLVVPRLKDDLKALLSFTELKTPHSGLCGPALWRS